MISCFVLIILLLDIYLQEIRLKSVHGKYIVIFTFIEKIMCGDVLFKADIRIIKRVLMAAVSPMFDCHETLLNEMFILV